MRIPAAVLLLALPALVAASPGFAADPAESAAPPAATPDRHPELKRLAPQEDVWVDVAKKEVVVGCRIAMAEGPIEVFACPEKTKEHEAIVATRSSARIIHAGLLAIGLDPGSPVSFDPVYAAASGPAVAIRMRWKDAAGTPQESRAQDWIRNAETGKSLAGANRSRGGRFGPPVRSAGECPADKGGIDVANQLDGPDPRGEHEPEPAPQRLLVAGHDRQQVVGFQRDHLGE